MWAIDSTSDYGPLAQAARGRIQLQRISTVDVRAVGDAVVLRVTDNGHGGAQVSTVDSSLAGIRNRVHALDGQLSIESPPGGPTTITVTIPNR
jgi:signal transduction histidine kinase